MSVLEELRLHAAAREAWLRSAVERFTADDRVVAAWLWGSEGRGDADDLSDYDLFVALAADDDLVGCEGSVSSYGELLWSREMPYNAPAAGRYFSIGFAAPLFPLVVDWYWQPAHASEVGVDTRMLVEKRSLRRVDVETFQLFPNVAASQTYQQPADPTARLNGLLVWFWSMYGPAGKWAARGHDARLAEQLPLFEGVLKLAADHVGLEVVRPDAAEPFLRLQQLAGAMATLERPLRAAGVEWPDTSTAHVWLDVADGLRRVNWPASESASPGASG